MKFQQKFKPELCVSTDETRQHLISVHLDKAKSVLVATNGHMLAKVPCVVEAADSDGAVSPESMREARRFARKKFDKKMACVRVSKKLLDTGAAIYRRPNEGKFPPWESVMPEFKAGDKDTVTFGVNPRYLLAACQAMGADNGWAPLVRVTVKITKDMLEPILVEPGHENDREGQVAVVMPGRV